MKKLKSKDFKLRRFFKKNEINRLVFKFLISNLKIKLTLKSLILIKNSRKYYFKAFVRIKNRCYITNRSKSIFNFFKLSRIVIKELGGFGFICGLRQSSW